MTLPARTSAAWRATPAKASSRRSVAVGVPMPPRVAAGDPHRPCVRIVTFSCTDALRLWECWRMSTYPIAYEQHPPVERSRLTVFFRFLMVIPHLVWALFYGLAFYVVEVIAWFAILFTGQVAAGPVRLQRRLPALHHAGLHVQPADRRRVPPVRRRRASRLPDPDDDRPARSPVQPAEGLLPDHPRDPDLHPAVRHGDLAARRRRRALVRRRHHGQDAHRADRRDAPAGLVLRALQRLRLPHDRHLPPDRRHGAAAGPAGPAGARSPPDEPRRAVRVDEA